MQSYSSSLQHLVVRLLQNVLTLVDARFTPGVASVLHVTVTQALRIDLDSGDMQARMESALHVYACNAIFFCLCQLQSVIDVPSHTMRVILRDTLIFLLGGTVLPIAINYHQEVRCTQHPYSVSRNVLC